MHGQGMVHGDLKGVCFERQGHFLSLTDIVKANILIDETGHACLADFGLLGITSDTTSLASSSSFVHGGTFRWMSPEFFYPEKFGLEDSRRTIQSDCYALGMVMYEVLSGQVPFPRCDVYAVVAKVSMGGRPGRPRGAEGKWFTDGVWRIMERCWASKRDKRPEIEEVLRCLEKASEYWKPPHPGTVADSPTTDLLAWNSSNQSDEDSFEDSEASSTPHVIPSQLSQKQPPKGTSTANSIYPSAYEFPASPHDAPDYQGLRTGADDPNGSSDSKECTGISDRAS